MTESKQTATDPSPVADERSDTYLRALFDHPAIGLIITDTLGNIVRVNPAFCRMLKYSTQQLQGLNYHDITIEAVSLFPLYESLSKHKEYRRANGSRLFCLTSIADLHNSEGITIGKIILAQELPQEDEIWQRLKQQLVGLEALLDTVSIPVFFKDVSLRYQRANRAASTFLGLSQHQIIGRSNAELFPTHIAETIERQDKQVIESQSLHITPDTALPDQNGNLRYFSTYKSPLFDDSGQLIGLLDFVLDATERKLAESERLTQLEGQRDALVSEVHHRIKNHLQGVAGLLQRNISANPTLASPLRSVLMQVESVAGIYNLQSQLRGQHLKLGEVAAMVAELTPDQVLVNGNGQEAELPHQEAVPFALTLTELVSNALKHRLTHTGSYPVNIQIEAEQSNLTIKISAGPARLPPKFDFATGKGLGTGLRLVKTLLPERSAQLTYYQQQDQVVAELQINPPFVIMPWYNQ